ncbi:hypothetical protein B0H14DRAFT_3424331 [Mycena olivaceomarginata]|nr:hypothetical protein B0H14DRAFT_3424331 [Mycena olivaceomarginata]
MPAVHTDHTTMPIFNMNAQNASGTAPTLQHTSKQALKRAPSKPHHASPFKPNVARGDSILFCTNTRLTPPPLRPPTYLTRFALRCRHLRRCHPPHHRSACVPDHYLSLLPLYFSRPGPA